MDFYKLVSGGGEGREVSVFMCVTCEWRVCVCVHTRVAHVLREQGAIHCVPLCMNKVREGA